jgi:ParB family chromosome partitioning protein
MSKIKELAGKTASIQPRVGEKHQDRPAKTAPVMLYDATSRMHAAEQRAEELEQRLRKAEENSANLEISIEELHEVPGRRRQLTQEQFGELRENLRRNDLVTPITVSPRADGGYEIISGHNRVKAFAELGRHTIPAVIRETDAARADMNAFYANLLQPSLPDYEKFQGFQLIRKRQPELTQEQIAEMAGVSPALISRLLSFEDLPAEAHLILENKPETLGAKAASDLAILSKQGKADQVVDAIRKIAEEGIDQKLAVSLAARTQQTESAKPKADVVTYKLGKAQLCSYRKTDTTLRIDFKNAEHAAAVHEEIQKVLENYTASLKTGKKG